MDAESTEQTIRDLMDAMLKEQVSGRSLQGMTVAQLAEVETGLEAQLQRVRVLRAVFDQSVHEATNA